MILQATSNVLLGIGGLLLAFYTLPDTERYELRDAIVKRVTWLLSGLLFIACTLPLIVGFPLPILIDLGGLSPELDRVFTGCFLEFASSYPKLMWELITQGMEDFSLAMQESITACVVAETGQKIPDDFGGIRYSLDFEFWAVGRVTGIFFSVAAICFVLFFFRNWLLNSEPSNSHIANCFLAIVIGVVIQFILQGAHSILS